MKPLTRHTTIVIGLLTLELNPNRHAEQVGILLVHDLVVRVLEDIGALHANKVLVNAAELWAFRWWCWQQLPVRVELLLVVTRVWNGRAGKLLESWILPLGLSSDMINVEYTSVVVSSLLPSRLKIQIQITKIFWSVFVQFLYNQLVFFENSKDTLFCSTSKIWYFKFFCLNHRILISFWK